MNISFVLKTLAVAAIAVGGVIGGRYLFSPPKTTCIWTPPFLEAERQPTQRFALSTFDIRDQIEAPQLATDDGGHTFLAWASQVDDGQKAMFLSAADDEGKFAEATTVARTGIAKFVAQMKGKTITRESRMLPHIAIREGTMHAAWVDAQADPPSTRMMHATSEDGITFANPVCVHQSDKARPTFTALAVGPGGAVACSWLDNRDKVQKPFASLRLLPMAGFEPEAAVHEGETGKGTCPCCPTAATFAPDGTFYVAFRNIQDGYRDIAIARRKPGETTFEGPFPIVPPTWKFDGCPHDGASLAIVGDDIHVVWMDAHTDSPRCYYGKAKLTDMKFKVTDLHPITTGSQGNAKIAVDGEGTLHAVWEESSVAGPAPGEHQHHSAGSSRTIMYAQKHSCCPRFGSAHAIAGRDGAFQSRPTIIVDSLGRRIVAWNELDEAGKSVVVSKLDEKFGNE